MKLILAVGQDKLTYDESYLKQYHDYIALPLIIKLHKLLKHNRSAQTDGLVNAIEGEKKQQWHAQGQQILFDAKKENVALQLEAAFRERQMTVYNEVKRRLDYQVDTQNVAQSFQQKHLVNWVVDHVKKSITPQQEKDALKQCMAELKTLATKA